MAELRKILRISLGIFFGFFVSFTVAGYQGLLPVLIDEGVYSNLCHTRNQTSTKTTCTAQTKELNLMFTIAIGLLNMATLPIGFIISWVGPRLTSCLGAIVISIGVLIFAFSSTSFPAWMAGYILMAIGGPAVAFPLLSLPGLLPQSSGLIFSLCVAAFDGSAAIMLFFQLIHDHAGASIKTMFLIYLVFPVGLLLASWFIYDPPPPRLQQLFNCLNRRRISASIQKDKEEESSPLLEKEAVEIEAQKANVFFLGTLKQLTLSWPFLLVVAWFAVYLLAKYFYILTLDLQLQWLTGRSEDVDLGSLVFSIMLPCSAVFTPITGWILDRWGGHVAVMIIAMVSVLIAIFSIIPHLLVQYFTMLFFVFNRFFFFGTAPFMMAKFYGERGTSVLYGISLFIASAISYSNYGWSDLAVKDPNSFLPINVAQNLLCCAVGLLLSWRFYRWQKNASS